MNFTIAHFFCGIGGSALGCAASSARFGDHEARFVTVGGIDFDERACRDFERLTGAPALCADVHELEPAALRKFLGKTAPDVVMMSPPCKGFSGLLSAKRAAEDKYQLMNQLMLRALFLVAETWKKPPKLVFVENVPRIASRGKDMVRQCVEMLRAAGYAVATGNHDCGELGNLAQHRMRWFALARHISAVPQLIYQPPKLPVRACGEVLGPLPMPGDVELGGPMHSVPRLSMRNWVRLSLIPAGGDWRDLPGTLVEGQKRREKFRRDPVTEWTAPAETVTGPGGSASTNIADPRPRGWFPSAYRVGEWHAPTRTVTSGGHPSTGAATVADPRWGGGRLGVTEWNAPVGAIAGESLPNNGKFSVADPRFTDGKKKNWQQVAGVTPWDKAAPTITSGANIHAGAFQVADPRVASAPRAGAYRVLSWQEAAATITGSLHIDNGPAAVADPRIERLDPDKAPPWIPIIVAADGTWHRPLTTLELAVLQSLPPAIDGVPLVLDGTSHTRWREAIGNMVPPDSAESIGDELLRALLNAALGAFTLGSGELWVAPERKALVV